MNRFDILNESLELLAARSVDYGGPTSTFSDVAKMAIIVLGREFSARDIVMIMVLVKLRRTRVSPGKIDHYVDAINYLALAGEFATEKETPSETPGTT
jgi:hypothetical protein